MGIRGKAKYCFQDIIGSSYVLKDCIDRAIKTSKTSSPVLVFGETGTGKELFVQSIHNSSDRKDRVFLAQNCAAIPGGLLESILFGTVKGSFTGSEDRKGIFELADGGTLYLDELNSMPLELQGKLLRVIQERTICRLGSTISRKIDVRLITSSNEYPELLLEKGILRSDLYYRLNVVRIDIPPLRDRKDDIPELVEYFINKFNKSFSANISGFEHLALEKLILHNWEGNIRELENTLESIFNIKNEGLININDLKKVGFSKKNKIISLKQKIDEFEKNYILEILTIADFNVSRAAELLNVPRQTLQSKIKRLKIKIKH
jgi:arginine utilization regulatory protein